MDHGLWSTETIEKIIGRSTDDMSNEEIHEELEKWVAEREREEQEGERGETLNRRERRAARR